MSLFDPELAPSPPHRLVDEGQGSEHGSAEDVGDDATMMDWEDATIDSGFMADGEKPDCEEEEEEDSSDESEAEHSSEGGISLEVDRALELLGWDADHAVQRDWGRLLRGESEVPRDGSEFGSGTEGEPFAEPFTELEFHPFSLAPVH